MASLDEVDIKYKLTNNNYSFKQMQIQVQNTRYSAKNKKLQNIRCNYQKICPLITDISLISKYMDCIPTYRKKTERIYSYCIGYR